MRRVIAVALALAAAGPGGSALAARWDSGVRGRVTESPTCPVERQGDTCYAGYQTTIRIRSLPERALVKTIRSDEHGYFRTGLAPGRYRLVPASGKNGFPHCSPRDVTVKAGSFTRAPLGCDTGIR